eukprot:COSAG02_NODE_6175_length_3750_cov_22.678992_4_plen_135_part_00
MRFCCEFSGGTCDQKEKRSAVRAQLSMLRQLVDSFIQTDLPEQEDEVAIDIDDGNTESNQIEATSSSTSESSQPAQTTSVHRRRAATLSDQSFGKVGVGVKLGDQQRVASFDIKPPRSPDGVSQTAQTFLQERG